MQHLPLNMPGLLRNVSHINFCWSDEFRPKWNYSYDRSFVTLKDLDHIGINV